MNKGKYTYVWVSFVILVFGILFVPKIIDRVKGSNVTKEDRLSKKEMAYLQVDGEKRKVPEFAFLNQDSLLITNKDYLGKVFLVEFFFTTCPTICPIMNKNLVEIQDEFTDFENFGVASFTINPDYDTPIVLKAYAEKYGITNLNWNLMTGDLTATYDLANVGFSIFAKQDEKAAGGFEHSGYFALVDKEGYMRSRLDSFGNPIIFYKGTITEDEGKDEHGETQQITILKEDIKKLLEE